MQKSLMPLEIKIATVVAVTVILRDCAMETIHQALEEMSGGASDFFDDELAVIDLAHIADMQAQIDWVSLKNLLKSYGLNAVAVRNCHPEILPAAQAAGLSLDANNGKPHEVAHVTPSETPPAPEPLRIEVPVPVPVPVPAPAPVCETLIIDTPVRAGQRIYARGADLIITAVVNNGAEIIADGSIHVYAPMRGRALAGASGNKSARIFAFALEPELVSIAGMYRTFEDGFPGKLSQQPVVVKLLGEKIDISPVPMPGARN
ncbi:septum site-determining protein MinC [Massilia sp. W12]|uniref:septum site-determining protein MinC n=1 Tax=Massilia sp. W12 TaxID=3126507 RepID=UPI0030CA916C